MKHGKIIVMFTTYLLHISSVFCYTLSNVPAVVSDKKHKYTVTPYTSKPGPNSPLLQNQPGSASKHIKQPSRQLTNHNWLTVFEWIDVNPNRSQQDVVGYFAN